MVVVPPALTFSVGAGVKLPSPTPTLKVSAGGTTTTNPIQSFMVGATTRVLRSVSFPFPMKKREGVPKTKRKEGNDGNCMLARSFLGEEWLAGTVGAEKKRKKENT